MGVTPAPKAPAAKGPGQNPLLNPNAPLSGAGLQQAATALTNAQTLGPITELAKQIAQQNAQSAAAQQRTAGYFGQLGGMAQQGFQDESQVANDLNAQLAKIGQGTHEQLGQIQQGALQNFQRYSPQGQGAGLNAAGLGSLSTEIARQQGLSAQNLGAFKSFGAQQGANARSYAASNLGTFASRGQEDLAAIGRAGRLANMPLQSKMAGLQASRGSLLAANEGKLRQNEISNQIASAGLGIRRDAITAANQRTAATITGANQRNAATITAANARNAATIAGANARNMASNASADARNAANIRAANARNAANLAARRAGLPPAFTPTGQRALAPEQQQQRFAQIDSLRSLIVDAQQKKLTAPQIRQMLADGRNPAKVRFDPALIDAAYALQGWGFLTQTQITALNKLGLIVGNRYPRGTAPVGAGIGAGIGG